MDNALELFSSGTSVARKPELRLNLLIEREPAHKTFLSNLRHAFQPAPAITRISLPGDLWHDVFLPTAIPWKSFQESLLWHFVVIFAGWALTQGWVSRPQPHVRESSYRSSGSIYYSPSKVFPSTRSSPPKARPTSQAKSQPAARSHGSGAMPVAAENRGTPKLVVPPDLKLAEGPRAPNLGSSNPTMPSVPLSATARAQEPLGGMNAAIAPPPDVKGGGGRLSGLAAAAVAPPADLAGMGGRRALRGPGASVVEPPPSIQGAGRGLGTLGAPNHVIAPPPQLRGEGLRAGVGLGPRALASGTAGVVAPPPSVEHSGRPGLVSGPGIAVVPPAPAAQAAGLAGGLGRGGSPGGVGPQVVPPPPSVQSGGGVLGALSSLFSSGSSKVVPPPPTLQGSGNGGGSGEGSRMASLGGGSEIVPPPPAVQAGGGNGKGRITSLGSGGSEIVPPPPTLSGAGGAASGRGGLGGSGTGGGSSAVAPPPSLSGLGNGAGKGFGSGRHPGGISGDGTGVVPPPPSVQGGTGTGGGGTERFGALAGTRTQVVPPPPGLQGTGNGSHGNGGALIAGGGGVIAPPPSIGEGGGSGSAGNGSGAGGRAGDLPGGNLGVGAPPAGTGSVSTGPLEQMDPLTNNNQPAAPSPESAMNVPLRLVGVPVLSSKTSFFSNYEVFIAERRVNQTQTELIELVYVFLPYQKRLSEYDLNTTKVYKLRVTKDPRCDESLMSMTWPEGDQPDPETQAVTDKLATADKNTKLPCYHTTADDFQRAIAH